MASTIAAVMRHLHNYFERTRIKGEISIRGGVVSPAVEAPYVYISGSAFHDGVRTLDKSTIQQDNHPDETFAGCMWELYPPDEFLAVCEEIAAFDGANAPGALISESLGEYSYTRATGKGGAPMTWEDAFAARLAPWRRMFTEVG